MVTKVTTAVLDADLGISSASSTIPTEPGYEGQVAVNLGVGKNTGWQYKDGTWAAFGETYLDFSTQSPGVTLAAGESSIREIAAPGAELGDFVSVGFSVSTGSIACNAHISSPGVVFVVLTNHQVYSNTIAVGICYLRVYKRV